MEPNLPPKGALPLTPETCPVCGKRVTKDIERWQKVVGVLVLLAVILGAVLPLCVLFVRELWGAALG